MTSTLLQWNVRGLRANYNEIQLLIGNHSPIAVCLQETFLKETDKTSFRNHTLYSAFSTNIRDRPCGGVTIIVNNRVSQSPVTLNTNLQACAVRLSLFRKITLCCVYLPPTSQLNVRELDDLLSQLQDPCILLGDFNGHNILWGCRDTNSRGLALERFILNNNLCLLNNRAFTYLHPGSGHYSALDLTLCSPSLVQDLTWEVDCDLHGSDHFPVILRTTGRPTTSRPQRWKLHRANWSAFSGMCEEHLTIDQFDPVTEPVAEFTTSLVNIAYNTIPKTSPNAKRFNKPWYNEQCKAVIAHRKRLLRVFTRSPTPENLNNFRIARANARRVIRQSQRSSWRQYVSKMRAGSSVKSTWDRIRRINGKGASTPITQLTTSNGVVEDIFDISNTLGSTFAKCSSSDNYTATFRSVKSRVERITLNFRSGGAEEYNELFNITELREALHQAHDTAVGPDDVHYQFLKHLPDSSMQLLLALFNRVWDNGTFPSTWRDAIVIPLPKAGKDRRIASNYRPIALTSCICKTMERMVNNRLVWVLETGGFFTEIQSGFRRQRSTVDHLIRLETCIREAFLQRQHLVAVFFDLEKAYDTTWKYGILRDLHNFGLRGRMPLFLSNFLQHRKFRVRLGTAISDQFDQEMGVPQGSILSVTLFNVKINDIIKQVVPGVESFLYVDDFTIVCRSANMRVVERRLQRTLNKLVRWSDENGFKFSQSKTVCVHFCNLRKLHDDPDLHLGNFKIPLADETKFLGVVFDRKLNFVSHIKQLKAKCVKSLNILKVVANTHWGADRKVLMRMYRALVRSKLDYGSVVYGSARKSYLQMLDPVHHQGIRLSLGAFRTSPAESLYVEANEPSLYRRRERTSLLYSLRLRSNPANPSYEGVFTPNYEELFAMRTNCIPPFGIRVGSLLAEAEMDLTCIAQAPLVETPPWKFSIPSINLALTSFRKDTTSSVVFRCKFAEVLGDYQNNLHFYTDGSKTGDGVACSAVIGDHEICERLPSRSSIFSAELRAIHLAVNYIIDHHGSDKAVIFTDSLSVLLAICYRKTKIPMIASLFEKISLLHPQLSFCWTPSHVGIPGNERADGAAKQALTLPVTNIYLPFTDLKVEVNRFVVEKWQKDWTNTASNKLRAICDSVDEWPFSFRIIRKEEVVLSRVRLGHTYLTHKHLLKGEPPPECHCRQSTLTVKHLLEECPVTRTLRDRYFRNMTTLDIFKSNFGVNRLLAFLRTSKVFSLI